MDLIPVHEKYKFSNTEAVLEERRNPVLTQDGDFEVQSFFGGFSKFFFSSVFIGYLLFGKLLIAFNEFLKLLLIQVDDGDIALDISSVKPAVGEDDLAECMQAVNLELFLLR